MASQSILLFFKLPEVGAVKTRLGREIGMRAACDAHEDMLSWRLRSLEQLRGRFDLHYYGTGSAEAVKNFETRWQLGGRLKKQQGNNLGERMFRAIENHLTKEGDQTLVVGSDIPFLSHELIDEAFAELDRHEVVLGPCEDGGYYLIGCSRVEPKLFDGVEWGGPKVLAQTQQQCERLGLRVHLLRTLFDVDDAASLKKFYSLI